MHTHACVFHVCVHMLADIHRVFPRHKRVLGRYMIQLMLCILQLELCSDSCHRIKGASKSSVTMI